MATKNSKSQNPQTPNPAPKIYKVGDIVRVIPVTGVVYEDNNAGYPEGTLRIQLTDGTKMRYVPKSGIEIAPPAETKAFLKTAPAELHPEAIIKREEEEKASHHGVGSPAPAGDQGDTEEDEEE